MSAAQPLPEPAPNWISWSAGTVAAVLFLVGLVFLQTQYAERDLVFCLVAYAAVALAALIAVPLLRTNLPADRLCLGACALFFGYIIVRALLSPDPYIARSDLYLVLAALTLYGLTATAFSNAGWRILLLLGLLTFGVVHVVVGAVQTGLGANFHLLIPSLESVAPTARATGFYVNPDNLAGLLEVLGIFGLSLSCWSRRPGWARVAMAYFTALCYLGLALTGSRGGYFSAAFSLIIFAGLSLAVLSAAGAGPLLRFGGSALLALSVAILIGWLFAHQNLPLRERTIDSLVQDEGRLGLWRAAIEQWKLRPLVGTGSGTYLFYGRQFRDPNMQAEPADAHNDYLELLAEYGIVGGAGFLFFFFAHLRRGWRSFLSLGRKRVAAGTFLRSDRLALNLGALGAISAYVIHSAVDFNLHIPANGLVLAFAFGIIANPGLPANGTAASPALLRVPRIATLVLALVLLVQSARLLPGESHAEQARLALRDENPAAAVSLANTALRHEKGNPRIYFILGRALGALSRQESPPNDSNLLREALAAFEQARRLAPLDLTYPLEMARVYDRLHRFAEAEPLYLLALERDPRSVDLAHQYQAHLDAWGEARLENRLDPPELPHY